MRSDGTDACLRPAWRAPLNRGCAPAAWLGRALGWTALVVLVPGCGPEEPDEAAPPPSGAVSAATPEATEAGLRILGLGGNAVDAAVAVSLALGVSEPGESGLGGAVVMLLAPRDREPVLLHAPPENVTSGALAFLRPTALPVLVHAWRRYGSGQIEWERLVEPAREMAERGFPLTHFRHRMMVREYRRLRDDPVAAALLLNPDLSLPGEGVEVAMPELAATLERLEGISPQQLPGGPFAALVLADLAELVDSAAARTLATPVEVREDSPARGRYRGWSVLTAGEPYAGPELLRALEFLESAPVDIVRGGGELRTAWIAEALGYASAPPGTSTNAYLAGTPPLPIAVGDTLPLRRPVRRTLPLANPTGSASGSATPAPPPANPATGAAADSTPDRDETSHFSIVDHEGNAVSVTQTLGGPFGARATRLGFFLARPAPTPPPPPADTADAAATPLAMRAFDPWAEPASWALPTVLVRDSVVGLALGSPGGPRALSAVVQTITGWVDSGLSLAEAIAAPRLHVELDTAPRPRLTLEGVLWSDPAASSPAALAPWGTRVRELATVRRLRLGEWDTGIQYQGLSPFYGGVNAVAREEGAWVGAADPRRDGMGRSLTEEDVLRARRDAPTEEEAPVPPPTRSTPGR